MPSSEQKLSWGRLPAPVTSLGLVVMLLVLCFLLVGVSARGQSAASDSTVSDSLLEGDLIHANLTPKYMSAYTAHLPIIRNWQVPTEVFKLGVLGPFSTSGQTGDEFKGAVTMAFDAIQWQIGKYRIEPIWIDSQSDPSLAAQAYQQAIVQDGVQAGILNWQSSVAIDCMEVTANYQVPHFFGLGASDDINAKFASDRARYGYWTTKGWPVPDQLSVVYVEALEDAIDSGAWSVPERTVAIYGEDSTYGRAVGAVLKAEFEDAGWTIVAEEYLGSDTVDFSVIVSHLVTLDSAVVAGTAPSWLPLFLKEAERAGLSSLIIADGLGWMPNWYDETGSASDYVLDQIPTWPTAEAKAFAAQFETRWGFAPRPYAAGLAYDGTRLFIAAAQAAYGKTGELSSEALYDFAQDQFWTGKWSYQDGIMMQSYKYTPETIPDPVVGEEFYTFPIVQYFGGTGKIIFPAAWAERPLTPPGE